MKTKIYMKIIKSIWRCDNYVYFLIQLSVFVCDFIHYSRFQILTFNLFLLRICFRRTKKTLLCLNFPFSLFSVSNKSLPATAICPSFTLVFAFVASSLMRIIATKNSLSVPWPTVIQNSSFKYILSS